MSIQDIPEVITREYPHQCHNRMNFWWGRMKRWLDQQGLTEDRDYVRYSYRPYGFGEPTLALCFRQAEHAAWYQLCFNGEPEVIGIEVK